jgi:hypothetical protein
MSERVKDNKNSTALLNATNWAAASFLGLFIPIAGLIFAGIAGTKAEKLLIEGIDKKEVNKIRITALAGGIVSVLSMCVYIYYLALN